MSNTTHASNRSIRPIAVAIAIALALGIGSTAQAQQYSYPGTASSSGHAARANAREAAATEVHDRYHAPAGRNGQRGSTAPQPAAAGNSYDYAHGTVRPIVARPAERGDRRAAPNEPSHAPARGYPQGGYGSSGNDYAHGTVHPIVAGPRGGEGRARPASAGDGSGPGHSEVRYGDTNRYPGSTVPRKRPDVPSQAHYGAALPNQSSPGNVSMQRGEACPVGKCSRSSVSAPASDPGDSHAHGTVTPVRAMPSRRRLDAAAPVRANAGYRGAASGISNTQTGVGSRAPAKTTDMGSQKFGQATTITNLHGQTVTLGGAQTITGLDGKPISTGTPSSIKGLNGQTYQPGVTHTPGSINGVSPHGDHNTGGPHLDNGGTAGVSNGNVSDFDSTHHRNADGSYSQNKPSKGSGSADANDGRRALGCSLLGYGCGGAATTTKVTDPRAVNFKKKEGDGVGDDPDVGQRGGGTLVSGTGKGINPGHRPGQDGGNPMTGEAPTGTGSTRNNATGAYVVTNKNGQDIPVKPKVKGAMTNSFNGVKGVTDPKRGGNSGGGGG